MAQVAGVEEHNWNVKIERIEKPNIGSNNHCVWVLFSHTDLRGEIINSRVGVNLTKSIFGIKHEDDDETIREKIKKFFVNDLNEKYAPDSCVEVVQRLMLLLTNRQFTFKLPSGQKVCFRIATISGNSIRYEIEIGPPECQEDNWLDLVETLFLNTLFPNNKEVVDCVVEGIKEQIINDWLKVKVENRVEEFIQNLPPNS